jgi:hypothetical protein
MTRQLFVLWNDAMRAKASAVIASAPKETRVEIAGPRRTVDQNARMWAMLADFAEQAEHHGRRYSAEQWKAIFMHALGQEVEFIPSLDGKTFIPLSNRTSKLTVREMCDLQELMASEAARFGVVFFDGDRRAA